MSKCIALAGNPNSGKTTLFNYLTGSTAHVGNWPGVTVERKEGKYKSRGKGLEAKIVDLPGIYSLSPYSPEEVVARNFIVSDEVDVVINIVDATNLERNLYLTTQIMEMSTPMVIALNMMDVVEKNKDSVDIAGLEAALGVPIMPISASQKTGIAELIAKAIEVTEVKREPVTVLAESVLGDYIDKLSAEFKAAGIDHYLYYAVKCIEGDEDATRMMSDASPSEAARQICAEAKSKVEDIDAEIADARYKYITRHCSKHVKKADRITTETKSDRIDRVLTNRVLGIPIFAGIMFLVFHLTFTENLFFFTGIPGPGKWLEGLMGTFVDWASEGMGGLLESIGASDWAVGLVLDGIFAGVGAVLGFLPLVLVLYLFISILEDSGYMARAAFIMDRLLRRFGLSGKSFVPMIMGFGCSVPAIAATRTIENDKDRRLTIMLIPFMSCGAKMPIYGLIVPIFFPNSADLVVTGIYLLGIVVAIICGVILKRTKAFAGDPTPFIMELPAYRMPSLQSLGIHLWDKFKGFAKKVGTIITLSTIVIWFLANFGFDGGFGMVEPNSAESILGVLGNVLKYIFMPLGFIQGPDGWKAAVAVVTGLVAKEAVVSTMGQLYTSIDGDALEDEGAATALATVIAGAFSIPAALSFITWNLLSVPCMAAVGAISQEMNDRKWFWSTLGFHLLTAWIVSFIVYWVGVGITQLI